MARIAEELALVTLSPEARQVVAEALAQEQDPGGLALWLEVRGVQHAQFVYDLYFQARGDAADDDTLVVDDELTIVVPKSSVDRLRGARLEWNAEGEGGLVLVNPNSPEPDELGVPEDVMAAGLDGPLGTRVRAVLEEMVNPSIAAHGGRSDLVAIDEGGGVAYLRLSGGCQGCAMSRMTLSQGIETALREEVPEITRVVDVTDHAVGANPYY